MEPPDEINQLKAEVSTRLHQLLKGLLKGKKTIEHHLHECLGWEKIKHEGELLQSHFYLLKKGMESISVVDWITEKEVQLKLDSSLSPQEEVAHRFKKSKKLKRGIEQIQKKLEKVEKQIALFEARLEELNKLSNLEEIEKFRDKWSPQPVSIKQKEIKKNLPYREFISETGIKIWVGKSAKDNDKLTFSYANGSDWWLHVDGYAGSHVVIKNQHNQEPDEKTLKDALLLAMHYSKAKEHGSTDVCFSQKKFVTPVGKGLAGKVYVAQRKIYHIKADPQRVKELQEQSAH